MTRPVTKPAVVERLLSYHEYLRGDRHRETFTSADMAAYAGCDCSQVRRDLAGIGAAGRPRIGYLVDDVRPLVESALGRRERCRAVLFGAGRLGSLLLARDWLAGSGVVVTAAFEVLPAKIGRKLHNVPVLALADAPAIVRRDGPQVAILAVPPTAAQACAELAVAAGVRAVWNFTARPLDLPPTIAVRDEDLGAGLTRLLCAMTARTGGEPLAGNPLSSGRSRRRTGRMTAARPHPGKGYLAPASPQQ